MEHVATLLDGHWELMRTFNCFLPAGHQIELLPAFLKEYQACYSLDTPISQPEADTLASGFVRKLHERFKDNPSRLEQVLRVLLEMPGDGDGFAEAAKRPSEMLEHIRPILQTAQHEDLWREFLTFVPQSWAGTGRVHMVVRNEPAASS